MTSRISPVLLQSSVPLAPFLKKFVAVPFQKALQTSLTFTLTGTLALRSQSRVSHLSAISRATFVWKNAVRSAGVEVPLPYEIVFAGVISSPPPAPRLRKPVFEAVNG